MAKQDAREAKAKKPTGKKKRRSKMIYDWKLALGMLVFAVLTAASGVAIDCLWSRLRPRDQRGFDVILLPKP
jgi:hypothetical protein